MVRKKVWKVDQNSTTGMQVTDGSAAMVADTGGHPNFVHVDDTGVYINGKQSWGTMPDNIRVGGLWVQNNAYMQMLPSTMAFPVPNLIIAPPIKAIANIAESVSWAMSLLL
jgi:hypothetical protein